MGGIGVGATHATSAPDSARDSEIPALTVATLSAIAKNPAANGIFMSLL
jgi:hypothetical protein